MQHSCSNPVRWIAKTRNLTMPLCPYQHIPTWMDTGNNKAGPFSSRWTSKPRLGRISRSPPISALFRVLLYGSFWCCFRYCCRPWDFIRSNTGNLFSSASSQDSLLSAGDATQPSRPLTSIGYFLVTSTNRPCRICKFDSDTLKTSRDRGTRWSCHISRCDMPLQWVVQAARFRTCCITTLKLCFLLQLLHGSLINWFVRIQVRELHRVTP